MVGLSERAEGNGKCIQWWFKGQSKTWDRALHCVWCRTSLGWEPTEQMFYQNLSGGKAWKRLVWNNWEKADPKAHPQHWCCKGSVCYISDWFSEFTWLAKKKKGVFFLPVLSRVTEENTQVGCFMINNLMSHGRWSNPAPLTPTAPLVLEISSWLWFWPWGTAAAGALAHLHVLPWLS